MGLKIKRRVKPWRLNRKTRLKLARELMAQAKLARELMDKRPSKSKDTWNLKEALWPCTRAFLYGLAATTILIHSYWWLYPALKARLASLPTGIIHLGLAGLALCTLIILYGRLIPWEKRLDRRSTAGGMNREISKIWQRRSVLRTGSAGAK